MKKLFDIIYKKSPIWFQNFIISVYGYKLYKQRYGKEYLFWLKYYKEKDYSDLENELANQEKEFISFFNYVSKQSPFYKDLYKNISNVKTIKDLTKLPVVNKEMFRKKLEDVYTISGNIGLTSFTGGTTGKALKVIFTNEDFQKRMAYLDAFKWRVGIEDVFKVKKATFSGRSIVFNQNTKIFWRNNFAYNQRLYSTFHLTEENLPYYISNLNKFKPEVVNGFVSSIYEMANFILRKSIKLSFKPKAIFTTSETLTNVHREVIEKVFKCKIYNQYASAEGAPFITECVQGNLHYNLDTGIIERDNNGGMIVTSFTTSGTPLIRYDIGDIVEFKQGVCECGSSHPLVNSISGRKVDYLHSKISGKISLSHLADVIKGNPNSIIKMQFVQKSIDEIDVRIVVDMNLFIPEHETTIMAEMIYRFGDEVKINIIKVDDIEKEKSGKYSIIKNLIANKT